MKMENCKLKDVLIENKDTIGIQEVSINNFVTTDNLLPNKTGLEKAKSLPPNTKQFPKYYNGDILVSNIRPYLKKIWYANKEGGASSDVIIYRIKDNFDSKYIFYKLFSDDFFDYIMKGVKGTKMPRGNKTQILEYSFPYHPSLPTQKKIASVLSALDAKIALNNKINAELEAMAKTIYDYWFVQYEFPNEKGKPYRSSGGKMVWNEDLKREIPVGWKVVELGEIAEIVMGQSPPSSYYNFIKNGIPFFQGSTDFEIRFPTIRVYTTKATKFAKTHDVLMSVRAPVGSMNIANCDCCIGRGLAALRSKTSNRNFLIYTMKRFETNFKIIYSSGTTYGSINKDQLFELKLCLPSQDILKLFERLVSPFYDMQFNSYKENQSLTSLRDFLLPLLMNGQVSVGE